MESIVEFALYTWVVVSILAILIQLVRIARHRRAKKHTLSAESTATSSLATETIDLEARSATLSKIQCLEIRHTSSIRMVILHA